MNDRKLTFFAKSLIGKPHKAFVREWKPLSLPVPVLRQARVVPVSGTNYKYAAAGELNEQLMLINQLDEEEKTALKSSTRC